MGRIISMSEIADEIIAEVSEHHRPLIIFDLDSTLFNVSLRTRKIVDAFVNDAAMREKFTDELAALSKIEITPRDWGLRQSIERSGIRVTEQLGKSLRDFWRSRFFSSEFLNADQPYPGSREGVKRLHAAGANVVYLTGRDERNMRQGTIESLKQWGFPLNFDRPENLIMKPIKGSVEDEEFKEIEMQKLVEKFQNVHRDIWFFENEPVIVERVRSATPSVRIVWVDTTHSGRAVAPTDLPILRWSEL